MLHISTLASIYHKPASVFIGNFKPKRLLDSPALIRGRTFGKDTPGTAAPKLGAAPIPNINLPMDNDYTSGVSNLARVNAKSLQLLNFGDDEDHAFGGTTSNTLSSSNRNEFDNIDFFSDAPPPPSSQNSGNNNVGNNYYNQQVGQLNMSILNELDPLGLFNEYPSMSSVAPSAVASPVTLMGNNETFPSSPQLSNNRGVGGINVSNNAPPGAGTLSVISPTSLQSANNPFAPSAAKVNISSTSTAPSNINIPQSSFASAGNADVILDPFASSRLVTPPAIPATSLNNNNTSTLLPNLQNLSLNSTAATMNPSPLSPPVAISPTDCFVAPKTQFLSPLNGKGLEINGVCKLKRSE